MFVNPESYLCILYLLVDLLKKTKIFICIMSHTTAHLRYIFHIIKWKIALCTYSSIQFMYTYTKILKTFLRGIFDPINYNAHTSYRNNSSLSVKFSDFIFRVLQVWICEIVRNVDRAIGLVLKLKYIFRLGTSPWLLDHLEKE